MTQPPTALWVCLLLSSCTLSSPTETTVHQDEPLDTGCISDAECSQGELCKENQCVGGCRTPADCDSGESCRQNECVPVPCVSDAECGGGGKCQEEACVEIGAAPCEDDGACGHRWRCSAVGQCIEGQCAVHPDCDPDQWCRAGLCADRRDNAGEVSIERIRIPALDAHRIHRPEDDFVGYGLGAALVDIDNDHDLDLFLGSRGPAGVSPCLYRNTSTPGTPDFEPIEGYCEAPGRSLYVAGGADLEGDGHDELIVAGDGRIELWRFHPDASKTDLMALVPEDDPRRACHPGAIVSTDLDMDGLADILVTCQFSAEEIEFFGPLTSDGFQLDQQGNIPLRQTKDGEWVLLDDPFYGALVDQGIGIAVGILDFDGDGLLDLMLANDDLISLDGLELPTGGAFVRCAPHNACAFELSPFGDGDRAWGAYMGFGNIDLDGHGERVYITDQGPNRLIGRAEQGVVDVAGDFGVDLGRSGDTTLFAWSVVVDDFDRNGLDDMLITQGMVAVIELEAFEDHRDTLLLQTRGGLFIDRPMPEHSQEDDGQHGMPYASRGALKADLDGDGSMEVLIGGMGGPPIVYRVQPEPGAGMSMCTLVPRTRYVPTHGAGFAVIDPDSGRHIRRDMQGQSRFAAASHILTEVRRGELRFPSGGRVAFECGDEPLVLEEPAWIQIDTQGTAIEIRLDTPWLDAAPTVRTVVKNNNGDARLQAAEPISAGVWHIGLGAEDRHIMLEVDGKWVGQWFSLRPSP